MNKYKVTITETLKMEVEIKASSSAEAEQIAEQGWNDEKYVLDYRHHTDTDFEAKPIQREREYER